MCLCLLIAIQISVICLLHILLRLYTISMSSYFGLHYHLYLLLLWPNILRGNSSNQFFILNRQQLRSIGLFFFILLAFSVVVANFPELLGRDTEILLKY